MNWSQRELHRRPEDAMAAGVCVGLAHYFEVDVALIRAGFIASAVFGGFGLAAYLALWILVDPPPTIESPCAVSDGEAADLAIEDLAKLSQNPAVVHVSQRI